MANTLSLTDFNTILEKMRGQNNKEVKTLNKNLESLNKKILTLARNKIAEGSSDPILNIASSRKHYSSLGENLREKVSSPFKKFSTLRTSLDTFGIIKKDTGGMIDQLLEKREAKKEYIKDQFLVNPQMKNTRENRKIFSEKFEKQQKIQKELSRIETKIQKLRDAGFTEDQIGRTDLVKQKDEQAARLVASDNRLYNMVKPETKEDRKLQVEKTGSKEEQTESIKISQDGIKLQQQIADDISAIKEKILNPEEKKQFKNDSSKTWLAGLLGSVGAFLLGKMGSLVGLLKAGIGAVLSPLLKLFGLKMPDFGRNTNIPNTPRSPAGTKSPSKVKELGKKALQKGKGLAKAGLGLASRVALPVAAVTAAGAAGWYAGTKIYDKFGTEIGDTIDKVTGTNQFDPNAPVKLEKPIKQNSTADTVKRTVEANTKLKEEVKKDTSSTTVVSAPTTNNVTSNQNIFGKSSPRNSEPTQQRYKIDRFML